MKKLGKFILYFIVITVLAGFVTYSILDKDLPVGQAGPKAEQLTDQLLKFAQADQWEKQDIIAWYFRGKNRHVWDRKNHQASVKWEQVEVFFDTKTRKGQAFEQGKLVADAALNEHLVNTAYERWINDGFWLLGATKVRDDGTIREHVTLDDGKDGLLIKYESGGLTPGDKYLWVFDDSGKPTHWQMWTSKTPYGGFEFSCDDWHQLPSGPMVNRLFKNIILDIFIEDIKVGKTLKDVDLPQDYFSALKAA